MNGAKSARLVVYSNMFGLLENRRASYLLDICSFPICNREIQRRTEGPGANSDLCL